MDENVEVTDEAEAKPERVFLDAPPKSVRSNPKADTEAADLIANPGRWAKVEEGVGKAGILSALVRAGFAGEVTTRNGEVWAVATVPLTVQE